MFDLDTLKTILDPEVPENKVVTDAYFYLPGAEATAQERIEKAKGNPRQIMHKNTRFVETPFDQRKIAEMTAQTASNQAQLKLGKIGHDGKELVPEQTPQVNGYGFVATPSPRPGQYQVTSTLLPASFFGLPFWLRTYIFILCVLLYFRPALISSLTVEGFVCHI